MRTSAPLKRRWGFPNPTPSDLSSAPGTLSSGETELNRIQIACLIALLAALAVIAAACSDRDDQVTAATSTVTPGDGLVSIGAGLSGIEGLEATVYTTGIAHASAFAFDDDGRLWVGTAAYTDDGSDGIYLVPGAGETPVEVVAGLHTVLGLLWYDGSLYVSAKEAVYAYSGFDGEAFSDQRTVVQFPAGVGEVNGIVLSPDGRMLAGISSPCDHCTPANEYSAAIVSFLPDGSDIQVYASGIRAPIALAYFPGTSDLFVTMNQRDDLGDATPGDWLSTVSEGDDWGFPDCYGQDGPACAGIPSPVAALDRHAALSGLAIVTGQLGAAVGNAAIVAEWQTGRVQMVSLEQTGNGYSSEVSPFLAGTANPVAVTLAPDGALLVSDWTSGTVYRIARV